MNKRGVSLVVASLLLTVLAIAVGAMIYRQMGDVVVSLAPEVDCYGMDFRAEIVRAHGTQVYSLNAVNLGNLQIEGFYIKAVREGELFIYEEVVGVVEPGATESFELEASYPSGNYLVIPRVEADDLDEGQFYKACKDLYGYEVVVE
ncbi:MAG: hypothetical protein ABH864_00165 [archaeon]